MRAQRSTYFIALCLCLSLVFVMHSVQYAPLAKVSLFNNVSPSSEAALGGPIVLTYVLMGPNNAIEGVVAIKSAMMLSSRPLDIHLICTPDAIPIVEAPLLLVQRPYYDVNVTFHVIPPKRIEERLNRAELGIRSSFGPKVLIHEILQGVKRTILVDTDSVFVVDPVQLWDTFDTFNDTVLMAFPNLGPTSHPGQICTCVMLLDLERMRDPPASVADKASSYANSTFLIPTPYHPDILTSAMDAAAATSGHAFNRSLTPHHDQGVWWALWYDRRELVHELSRRWDITACRHYYGLKLVDNDAPPEFLQSKEVVMTEDEHVENQFWTHEAGDDLVIPGIIHFNCRNDDNVWHWPDMHDNATTTWAPIITTIVKYKWIWLNRGTGPHVGRLLFQREFGVRWLDESQDVLVH